MRRQVPSTGGRAKSPGHRRDGPVIRSRAYPVKLGLACTAAATGVSGRVKGLASTLAGGAAAAAFAGLTPAAGVGKVSIGAGGLAGLVGCAGCGGGAVGLAG